MKNITFDITNLQMTLWASVPNLRISLSPLWPQQLECDGSGRRLPEMTEVVPVGDPSAWCNGSVSGNVRSGGQQPTVVTC